LGPSTVDVVLTWGRGGWRSLSVRRLAKERMVPVCSPGFAEAHGLERATNFWGSPRLAHTTRGDAWRAYAQATGAEIPGEALPVRLELEHFFMLLEAARAGAALALLPDLFVAVDIASGRLVAPAPAWATGAVYAAVASPAALARPAVAAFVDWLCEQAHSA
jgi:LysR family transcriptional regulator, glycine cleavage system transcriptional activator